MLISQTSFDSTLGLSLTSLMCKLLFFLGREIVRILRAGVLKFEIIQFPRERAAVEKMEVSTFVLGGLLAFSDLKRQKHWGSVCVREYCLRVTRLKRLKNGAGRSSSSRALRVLGQIVAEPS